MKNIVPLVLIVLVCACLGFCIWTKTSTPKIGYVRLPDLIDKYEGMKEARMIYKNKLDNWQSNIDTLNLDYQINLNNYNSSLLSLTPSQAKEREASLQKQAEMINQYVNNIEQKAKEEDIKVTERVLGQIESFVREYGDKKGFDIIHGGNKNGSIMYGRDPMDVTEDVLKSLNDSYRGKVSLQ